MVMIVIGGEGPRRPAPQEVVSEDRQDREDTDRYEGGGELHRVLLQGAAGDSSNERVHEQVVDERHGNRDDEGSRHE
jgi:hypothetical protein